jgi:arylsulfatase A-like enzyme
VPSIETGETEPHLVPETRPAIPPGDRLILALWVAVAVVVGRALLQAAVDASADGEWGATLAEHFLEHVIDATGRAWLIVMPLAVLPARGGAVKLRRLVTFGAALVLLAGWPGGELRYTPGFESRRGLQGWAVIVAVAAAVAMFDRYATSPRRAFQRWSPSTRFVLTACLLLLGGGALATLSYLLDRRRSYMEVESIVLDLLDELPRARATVAPDGRKPEIGSILADRSATDSGGNKPSLIVPVGSAVEFDADLERFASLSFSFAVDRGSPRGNEGPITFSVSVDGREQMAETVQPGGERRWVERRLELTQNEPRRVTVGLALRGEGSDAGRIRAGFGRPLLVRREWRPRTPAAPGRMNVVLVVVDSLRPDHLGCYGYARPTSPAIDRLAASGVVFEQAHAPSSWSWPSVASLFTGLWPPTHGVEDVDRCFLSDSIETLAEHFSARGCTTLGVTANPLINKRKNFQQGFEEWREFPLVAAPRLEEQFRDWVRRYSSYQFFAYVHFVDPHRPYNPSEPFATRFASAADATEMRRAVNELRLQRAARADPSRAIGAVEAEEEVLPALSEEAIVGLYDGEIAQVDEAISGMQRALADERLLDSTVFVVTSDHGEVLTAGRAPPLGATLARELLRVPLIVRDPRLPPSREKGVVDTTFVAPTLLAAAGELGEAAGEDGDVAPARAAARDASLPPWGEARPRVAFSHSARGLRPDGTTCQLLGFTSEKWRLVTDAEGQVIEFTTLRGDPARGPDPAARRDALVRRLLGWYEECRRNAVSRRFERVDFWTESSLRDFEEN